MAKISRIDIVGNYPNMEVSNRPETPNAILKITERTTKFTTWFDIHSEGRVTSSINERYVIAVYYENKPNLEVN